MMESCYKFEVIPEVAAFANGSFTTNSLMYVATFLFETTSHDHLENRADATNAFTTVT